MIQLENVSVKYGNTGALHPVSLDIKDSPFTVLLGCPVLGNPLSRDVLI